MKRFVVLLCVAAVVGLVASVAQASITVISGDIYTVDPTAKDYGAVRYKDFTNAASGTTRIYLANTSGQLGSNPNSDGFARSQAFKTWSLGSTAFSFEYRPVVGNTDLILTTVAGMTASSQNPYPFMAGALPRPIYDPLSTVNFISFYIKQNESTPPTPDSITLNLTDLDGNSLLPGALSLSSPPAGGAKWYLTDPALLANGFILTGNIMLAGTLEGKEGDVVQMAFGNSAIASVESVPEPATLIVWSLLGLSSGGLWVVRRRRNGGAGRTPWSEENRAAISELVGRGRA